MGLPVEISCFKINHMITIRHRTSTEKVKIHRNQVQRYAKYQKQTPSQKDSWFLLATCRSLTGKDTKPPNSSALYVAVVHNNFPTERNKIH